MKQAHKADILLLIGAAVWGCAFVAQRKGMEDVGPFMYTGIRFALGACCLLPFVLRHRGGTGELSIRKLLGWGFVAGSVLFAGAILQQVGLVYTTAGKAGFITGLYVVCVPLLGLLWKQRPGWGCWLGTVLCAVGLYFLSITADLTFAPGDLFVLIGAVVWACHVLLIGYLSPRTEPVKLACVQFAACSLWGLAIGFPLEGVTIEQCTRALWPILYGGVMSVGVGFSLQVIAQKDAPPTHAAIIMSLEAVFAALAGWLLLSEVLTSRAILGCALMLAGMLAAQLAGLREQRRAAEASVSPARDAS